MLSATLTKNSSGRPKEELQWLIDFTVKFVNKAKKAYPRHYTLEVGKTPHSYKGRHYGWKNLIRLWLSYDDKQRTINYSKWKNMPTEVSEDWQERFVYVLAHELAHNWFSGLKKGEFQCELMGQDAMLAFRKVREKFDKFAAKLTTKKVKLTPAEKAAKKRKAEYNKQIRWVRSYCKENNISVNLMRNTWGDELSVTLNVEGKEFEGTGDYMYAVHVSDMMERLQETPIVDKTED